MQGLHCSVCCFLLRAVGYNLLRCTAAYYSTTYTFTSASFVKADRRRPEGCAVHHAAGHVLAVALAAGCYMPNRVSYPKPSKIHNVQAAAVVMTQQGPAKRRGSHLTIMDAGSKTDMVISATDSCSWYAFSAEITGA